MSNVRLATTMAAAFLALPHTALRADGPSGQIELGYRDVRIEGDRGKYRQQVDLDDGLVLADLALRWDWQDVQGWTPSVLELHAAGQGSSPNSRAGLMLAAPGHWRLRWNQRRSDYLYSDLLRQPEDTLVTRSDNGDVHHVDVQRRHDQVMLALTASPRLELTADGSWLRRDGDSVLSYDVSREEFELDVPVDQRHWRGGLGASYRWDAATLHLSRHWRDDEDNGLALLPAPSGGSSTAPTALDSFVLRQPHDLSGDEQRLALRTHGRSPWRFEVDLVTTDVDVDTSSRELASGVAFNGQPLLDDLQTTGDLSRETRLVRGRMSWTGPGGVVLRAGLHDRLLDQDALLEEGNVQTATSWRLEHRGVELGIGLEPMPGLHLDAAVTSGRRRSKTLIAGAPEGPERHVTREDGYRVQIRWRPNRQLSLHLLAEDTDVDDPYTLAAATDAQRLRLTARMQWPSGVYLTGVLRREDRQNDVSGWRADQRDAQLRVGLAKPKYDISGGIALIDWSRDIDQAVTGGSRTDLFPIAWEAESTLVDASLVLRPRPRLELSAVVRVQDSNGSVPVERRDAELGADLDLGNNWGLGASWRRIDHSEEALEQFDADVLEVRLRRAW